MQWFSKHLMHLIEIENGNHRPEFGDPNSKRTHRYQTTRGSPIDTSPRIASARPSRKSAPTGSPKNHRPVFFKKRLTPVPPEFEAFTPYFYSTYEPNPRSRPKAIRNES